MGWMGQGTSCDFILQASAALMPHMPSSCPGKLRRTQSDENEQSLSVKQVFLHPLYNANTYENDVALVELSRGPVLNDFVMPICLPQEPLEEGTTPTCDSTWQSLHGGFYSSAGQASVPAEPADCVCLIPQPPSLKQLNQSRLQGGAQKQARLVSIASLYPSGSR